MQTVAVNRAVLCDDDTLLRGVVRRLMEEAGYLVVAEAADCASAEDAMLHNAADIVVLDLSMPGGHGETLLRRLRERGSEVRVVVFSSFVHDTDALLRAGATAVVEKPDFARLDAVLGELLVDGPGGGPERRRPAPRTITPLPPPTSVSLSGFEAWASFVRAVSELAEGDALLAIDVVPEPVRRDVWDDVHRLDHCVAFGRVAVTTRRLHDRVSIAPAGVPVLALVGGHPEAPGAVFDRLERVWQREAASGTPVGAFGHVHRDTPAHELLDQVVASLVACPPLPEQPLRIV